MFVHTEPSMSQQIQETPTSAGGSNAGQGRRTYMEHWQQLAIASAQVQKHPELADPRFVQIEALIGLGLSTLARREADRLDGATNQQARVESLTQSIGAMACDRITLDQRESHLRANLNRLTDRVRFSESDVDQWRSIAQEISWYRASDGNIVRCNESLGRIAHLADTRTAHLRAVQPLVEQMGTKRLSPIILEGIDPHWLLGALLGAPSPDDAPMFRQRLLILQADLNELFDGLSCADIGEPIASERIEWFVGHDGPERLLGWWSDRLDDVPPTMVIQNPLVRARAQPDGRAIMKLIDERWTKSLASHVQWVKGRTPKNKASIAAKLQRVLECIKADESPEPGDDLDGLRVLIPTSRYTTYLQYVSRDLAQVLSRAGCECEIQIEDDDSSVYSKSNYLRAFREFDPDVVISINTPRPLISEHSPTDVVHVCWIQDAMDHLFDAKIGKQLGETDFVVGMVKRELIEQFEYPEKQASWMPMVASGSKFNPQKTIECQDYDCEIAWVTHQSEHPDLLKSRLVDRMRQSSPGAVDGLIAVLDEVKHLVTSVPHTRLFFDIDRLIDRVFFPNGVSEHNQVARSVLLNTQVIPYAERVFRHQVAMWASRIADRRGWRFRLFGNGWDQHPQLSGYAAGPVEHNDALVECYQRSAVHLHASVNQVMHQRVSECLLSGGLPLCRSLRDAFAVVNNMVAVDAHDRKICEPVFDDAGDRIGHRVGIEKSTMAQQMIDELRRLGICEEDEYRDASLKWAGDKVQAAMESLSDPIERANAQMFSDSTDLFFASESQLEALLDKAINEPAWRSARIEQGVAAMPKEMTMDGFVENLLTRIHAGLTE